MPQPQSAAAFNSGSCAHSSTQAQLALWGMLHHQADTGHAESERSSRGPKTQQTQSSPEAAGDDEDEVAKPTRGSASVTAEQGLKHLLLTVDVERLYRSSTLAPPSHTLLCLGWP